MKVFLSSTAQDLAEYRKVADDTIRRLALTSVAMEFFGPLPGAPVEECEHLARESDVVVCIVAHRYGHIPEKGRGSITRREIEAANNANRDVLVWIVADEYAWSGKKEQDLLADPNVLADRERVTEVAEGVAGLLDFKAWLRTTFTPDTFTTPDDLGKKIAIALANYMKGRTAPPISQDRISIARLPTTSSDLFGREKELQLLDEAWENEKINIVSFVAWGGVGKTALVNQWLKRRMARDNYRGAERVYAWSFFSQGTTEGDASADLFIHHALRWFGDSDPTTGSPFEKGERLAGYVRRSRTLLILDGLEPLQYPLGPQEGRLKDIGLQAMLVELAAQQPGLCVISSRARLTDLIEFESATVIHHNLEELSPPAGAQILRALNVKGDEQQLQDASVELGGHAFSLTLLGSYLDEVMNGDIARRKEIENLFEDTRYGNAAHRMMAAYEKWLGQGIELAILRLVGLFDRPADPASVEALCKAPAIPGLTEALVKLNPRDWNRSVAKLRRIRLLADAAGDHTLALDSHRLVREHFKQQLKQHQPDAWREAHSRLYEHLKNTAKPYPDTVEEMSPLYSAVVHGCSAGRFKEALSDIYFDRIQRGHAFFNLAKLGAFGADLSVISAFFENTWTQPAPELDRGLWPFVLAQASSNLRAVGRLQESLEPLEAALDECIRRKKWLGAANNASLLSQTYIAIGNLQMGLKLAKRNIELANQADDKGQRLIALLMLGRSFYHLGRTQQAGEVFKQAEELRANTDEEPTGPTLHGVHGYEYGQLLLEEGKVQEVKERVENALTLDEDPLPLGFGFNNLLLGLALMTETETTGRTDYSEAASYVNKAVDALRVAGQMEFMLQGLLVRSKLHRLNNNYDRAQRDLAEVFRIASSSGMGLHLADHNLESAKLMLVQDEKDKAREYLITAREMIKSTGYHRRDKEVAELEAQLA